ncbi:MAG TPA: hypothetical protein VMZ31_04400 [Phycisphaerae bacterium]|nr:hypothetical protein [Phycisphaerae bacterium]
MDLFYELLGFGNGNGGGQTLRTEDHQIGWNSGLLSAFQQPANFAEAPQKVPGA